MIYLISEILICFFAVIGASLVVMAFFDYFTAKKTGIHAKILITEIDDHEDSEYSLRILESQLSHSVFSEYVSSIVISQGVYVDNDVFKKLSYEYKNLEKEE